MGGNKFFFSFFFFFFLPWNQSPGWSCCSWSPEAACYKAELGCFCPLVCLWPMTTGRKWISVHFLGCKEIQQVFVQFSSAIPVPPLYIYTAAQSPNTIFFVCLFCFLPLLQLRIKSRTCNLAVYTPLNQIHCCCINPYAPVVIFTEHEDLTVFLLSRMSQQCGSDLSSNTND